MSQILFHMQFCLYCYFLSGIPEQHICVLIVNMFHIVLEPVHTDFDFYHVLPATVFRIPGSTGDTKKTKFDSSEIVLAIRLKKIMFTIKILTLPILSNVKSFNCPFCFGYFTKKRNYTFLIFVSSDWHECLNKI